MGIASFFMKYLEDISNKDNAYYIDLFVRPSNENAVSMYKHLGYEIYQTIDKYYSNSDDDKNGEDSYDMRKSLKKDINKELMQPTNKKINVDEIKFF